MGTHDGGQPLADASYRRIVDTLPQAVVVFDPTDGAIIDANDAASELFCDPDGSLVGSSVDDVGLSEAIPLGERDSRTDGSRTTWRTEPGNERQVLDLTVEQLDGGDGYQMAVFTDATERHERENRLVQLTENADDVFWLFSGDWSELLFVNSAYEDIWGRDIDAAEEDPTDFLQGVHPDDRELVVNVMERLSAGESTETEYRVNESEDFERWVWVRGSPIFDDDGNVIRVAGFARDITELKRRQQDLADTRKRLETLYETAPDAIIAADADTGKLVEANAAAEDLFGRPREELLSMRQPELHPAGEREAYGDLFESHVEQEGVSTFSQFEDGSWMYAVRADGEQVPIEISARTTELGDRKVVYGILRDISDRKETQERFEALNRMAISLSAAESEAEACQVATQAAASALGKPYSVLWTATDDETLTVEEATGVGTAFVDADEATLTHERGAVIWDAFEAGETEVIDEISPDELGTADIPIESVLLVPIGTHGILTVGADQPAAFDDVDEYLATLLAKHIANVLDRIEYEQALEEYQEELERSNENLQQFAYIASHDLQEPLRMVSSYVDLLAAEYGDELDEEGEEYVDFAVDGANRMREMINALLDYSRVETKANEFETVDVDDLLAETLKGLDLFVEEHGATVHTESMPTVVADRNQLGQVFQNLIKNAIEHGGADDDGAPDGPVVAVTAEETSEAYRFAVSDDGDGIPTDKQDDIFDIFDSGRDGGTGIGLAVCERIVTRHDGTITVDSAADEGATFTFTIPKQDSMTGVDTQ